MNHTSVDCFQEVRKKDFLSAGLRIEDQKLSFFRSARASWNTSVRPSVSPLVRKKNLDHIYTGIYAS